MKSNPLEARFDGSRGRAAIFWDFVVKSALGLLVPTTLRTLSYNMGIFPEGAFSKKVG